MHTDGKENTQARSTTHNYLPILLALAPMAPILRLLLLLLPLLHDRRRLRRQARLQRLGEAAVLLFYLWSECGVWWWRWWVGRGTGGMEEWSL